MSRGYLQFFSNLTSHNDRHHWRGWSAAESPSVCMPLCTPGMGVNLWGVSPLYVNPVNVLITLTKVLAEGKGGTVRDRLEEAGAQSYEPTNRNSI